MIMNENINEKFPLISVIIPVYNVEKYLEDCLKSVCGQTYKNLEIIIVDDGSEDQSYKICEQYQRTDNRIRLIHQNNQGLSAARNTGINVAHGKYYNFTDSDDYVNKYMLEILYKNLKNFNAAISAGDFRREKENQTADYAVKPESKNKTVLYEKEDILKYLIEEGGIWLVSAWNKLYRAELFRNIRYPVGKRHEDEFIIHRLLYASEKIVFDNRILYYYRERQNSIIGLEQNRVHADELEAYKERIDFFHEIQYSGNIDKLLFKYIITADLFYDQAENRREKKRRKQMISSFSHECMVKSSANYQIRAIIFGWSPKLYHFIQKIIKRK